jgi:hypothetical protein
VGVVAVGGGIGVVGTYLGTRLQMVHSRKERQAAEHNARVARVAAVLGPIRTLLIDTSPERIVWQGAKLVEGYWERWLPLRDELEIVAVTEPSAEMREQMRLLEAEFAILFGRLTLMVSRELRQQAAEAGSTRNPFEDAVQNHAEAERLAEAILTELHGDGAMGEPPQGR